MGKRGATRRRSLRYDGFPCHRGTIAKDLRMKTPKSQVMRSFWRGKSDGAALALSRGWPRFRCIARRWVWQKH